MATKNQNPFASLIASTVKTEVAAQLSTIMRLMGAKPAKPKAAPSADAKPAKAAKSTKKASKKAAKTAGAKPAKAKGGVSAADLAPKVLEAIRSAGKPIARKDLFAALGLSNTSDTAFSTAISTLKSNGLVAMKGTRRGATYVIGDATATADVLAPVPSAAPAVNASYSDASAE